jgi:GNAT superfamily N-acetyltransferase
MSPIESEAAATRPEIREMMADDIGAVARLCGELGYPASAGDVAVRLEDLAGRADEALFVAEAGGAVIGWIHVGVVHALTHSPEARVHGLVVASGERGRGTGRALLARAESWSAAHGLSRVRLTSRISREDAHGFYVRCGYRLSKTSHVFERNLI